MHRLQRGKQNLTYLFKLLVWDINTFLYSFLDLEKGLILKKEGK